MANLLRMVYGHEPECVLVLCPDCVLVLWLRFHLDCCQCLLKGVMKEALHCAGSSGRNDVPSGKHSWDLTKSHKACNNKDYNSNDHDDNVDDAGNNMRIFIF